MKKLFKSRVFIAFLLSFCLGALIILPNLIYGLGRYNLTGDFSAQQIPFNMMINDSLKEGSFLWTWFNDLGSNFIGTFSFYNIFSPFNLITYLFPSTWFPYLIGWVYILKYAVAGVTSYLFLKRYVKKEKLALLGSLLYTFSGFQLTNMVFYHFHDVVAFFPLLLYTLDNLIYDDKKIWFGLSISLLAFTNWFFFIGQCVFLVLYFIVKVLCHEYKITWKKFLYLVFEGLCGVGIAMIVLLPTLLFTISNPRVADTWKVGKMFIYPFKYYIEIIRGFILPAESMFKSAFISSHNFQSIETYLPFVGILLVLGCLIKNYKKWYSILFIVCLVIIFIPIFNSSFFMFTTNYYARWFYMIILIMSLMSIKCLEDKCSLNIPLFINFILLFIVTYLCIIYRFMIKKESIIFDEVYLIIIIITCLICLIGTYLLCRKINGKKTDYLICCVFIFSLLWGNYMTYQYRVIEDEDSVKYRDYLNIKDELSFDDIRVNASTSCMLNMGYLGRFSNLRTFNSNINGSSFNFYKSIGYDRTVKTELSIYDDELQNFLGVKYFITCGVTELKNYELVRETENYYVYKNNDYKEFGFNTNKYMLDDEFNKLNDFDKKVVLNKYIILNDEQVSKYGDLYLDKVHYNSNSFKYLKNGFSSKIDSSGETIAIYTIPYDRGWKATNNGKNIVIENVDNGMMGIKINKGINNIKFSYFTPGLKSGLIISIVSLILYGVYIYLIKIKKVI